MSAAQRYSMTGAERDAQQADWAAVLRHLLAVWAKVIDPALAEVIQSWC